MNDTMEGTKELNYAFYLSTSERPLMISNFTLETTLQRERVSADYMLSLSAEKFLHKRMMMMMKR